MELEEFNKLSNEEKARVIQKILKGEIKIKGEK